MSENGEGTGLSIIDEPEEETIATEDNSSGTETEDKQDKTPASDAKEENKEKEADAEANEPEKKDGKEGDEATKAPEWALEVPEDFPLPADNLKSFTEAAKKLGLSMEQAKGMLDWHKDFHNAVMADNEMLRKQTLDAWQKEMDKDSDFGGARFKATVADARKAFSQFDPDGALRKVLRQSGYDRHPAIIRVVARVVRAMGEHAFVDGNGAGGKTPLEERLWNQMS